MRPDYNSMIGSTIGRWNILGVTKNSAGSYLFLARCECGTEKHTRALHVLSGRSKSCGCYAFEGKAHRKPAGHAGLTSVLIGYKKNAESRGYSFNLSREHFTTISQMNCFYCGTEPANKCAPYASSYKKSLLGQEAKEHASFTYNGIDRRNNNLGYSLDNCVACCKICNFAKNTMSENEFISWINKVYTHVRNSNAVT